jgi:hypothetical protein
MWPFGRCTEVLTLGIVSCLLCTCLVGVFDILLVVLLVVGLVVSFFVFGSPPRRLFTHRSWRAFFLSLSCSGTETDL